jgi:hypothetical protein
MSNITIIDEDAEYLAKELDTLQKENSITTFIYDWLSANSIKFKHITVKKNPYDSYRLQEIYEIDNVKFLCIIRDVSPTKYSEIIINIYKYKNTLLANKLGELFCSVYSVENAYITLKSDRGN